MLKTILAPLAGAFFLVGWSLAPAQAQSAVPTAVTTCGGGATGSQAGYGSTLTVDLNGTLCTNSSGGGGGSVTQGTSPWVDNVTQWASGVLGAMANYGTSPGAVLVPGVNAFVTSGSITANAGTNLNTSALALDTSVGTTNTDIGPPGATACATDTGSCSVNALLQRVAQRLTSILGSTGVTMADGANVTQGAIADAAYTGSGNATVVAALKGIYAAATAALPAGTNTIGGTVPTPATTGGLSVYFVQPAASDNHVVIKAGAGQVYKVSVTNNSATINYLRLYNATTGFNGCNSATNIVYQMAIPASTSGAGYSDSWETGIAFATGISICVTSGYATNDTTNATASAMSVNVGYK
jgi:hypothetical protein